MRIRTMLVMFTLLILKETYLYVRPSCIQLNNPDVRVKILLTYIIKDLLITILHFEALNEILLNAGYK